VYQEVPDGDGGFRRCKVPVNVRTGRFARRYDPSDTNSHRFLTVRHEIEAANRSIRSS
jgi:hypothetical protein